ncbi:hypothetical protein RYH80_10205 [Halobaculum sp. MBLA0147]|uniref:hypothetical protein n=1 Tax=Halobaculum sp. MBLA0147 TaxID=3079934 RepID=UPI0035251A8E
MSDSLALRVVRRLDPIPLLPADYREPAARVLWLPFAPAYLLGMLVLLLARLVREVHAGVGRVFEAVAAVLILPCTYLYESYWAP